VKIRKLKIRTSIFCGSERTQWINPALFRWFFEQTNRGFEPEVSLESGYWPVSYARNVAAQGAIDSRADWLMMVDNDVVPHQQFFEIIQAADQRGLDCVALNTHILDANCLPVSNIFPERPVDAYEDELFEQVLVVGTGCFAIRVSVFERLEKPFFRLELNPTQMARGFGEVIGEDQNFCRSLQKAGVRVCVPKEISAVHLKTCDLLLLHQSIEAKVTTAK
jgi:hypothetical protein